MLDCSQGVGCFKPDFGSPIKGKAYPRYTLGVRQANSIGGVPCGEAFLRGEDETTLCGSSRLPPEVGDLLGNCAMERIAEGAWEGRTMSLGMVEDGLLPTSSELRRKSPTPRKMPTQTASFYAKNFPPYPKWKVFS